MRFVLQMPSLQHLAEVQIVAALWNQRHHFAQIEHSLNGLPVFEIKEDTKEWKLLENEVVAKVSALPLSEATKTPLLNMIKPLGKEIIVWCRYHSGGGKTYQLLENLLPQHFCWTMRGTIDYTKTAELMLKDEKIDVDERYELACLNCLEDQARELFHSMGEMRRRKYILRRSDAWKEDQRDLITLMTYTFIGTVDELNGYLQTHYLSNSYCRMETSFIKWLFLNTLSSGSRATSEYLFEKLSPTEKEQVFKEYADVIAEFRQSPTCSMLYYLSLMNEQRQQRLFRDCTYRVLRCLLGWPMQYLFIEAAQCGWRYMSQEECGNVLRDVAHKIRLGYRDYDYVRLFWKCWHLSMPEHKQYYLGDSYFLKDLVLSERVELIQLVLNAGSLRFLQDLVDGEYEYCKVIMDERVVSDAALMECKETAALESSKDRDNMEKRWRSQRVSQMVDIVLESRDASVEFALFAHF